MGKITDIERWRLEIQIAEKIREDEFGKNEQNDRTGAAENLNYYENGFSDRYGDRAVGDFDMITTLNIVDSIVSIIVPSLYFKNPKTIALPLKVESEKSAPIAAKIIDYYRKQTEAEVTNQKIIMDAYLLGYGCYKVGYVTKFGKDVLDEEEKPKKSRIQQAIETVIGKEKEEVIQPDLDQRILAESPFIEYISPFKFLKDPRATSINDAQWVCHEVRKTVKSLKENPKYKNTDSLNGNEPDDTNFDMARISKSELDAFRTVDLYEIHYRNEGEWYILVISKDGSGTYREHYHEESIYDLNEWQFDELFFKMSTHKSYPKSDITKIKNLQDRLTNTIDSILEQVDKYVPKIAYDMDGISPEGERALKFGDIGALVKCTKNPAEVFRELNFTQLKADLQALIEQVISLISIQTGLTRAQLTGVSQSATATEATLEQGGQNIRLADMSSKVQRMVNRQSTKFWKIIKQFVSLEELQLIIGTKGVDPETGLPLYDWLTIDDAMAEKLQAGEYDFDIEVGSTEKVTLGVVRKAFENMFNILARTEVIALMQQQGDKVQLAEILKSYIGLFPEMGIDASRVIQKITQGTQGLIPTESTFGGPGGTTQGSNVNELRRLQAESAPTQGQEINQVY